MAFLYFLKILVTPNGSFYRFYDDGNLVSYLLGMLSDDLIALWDGDDGFGAVLKSSVRFLK